MNIFGRHAALWLTFLLAATAAGLLAFAERHRAPAEEPAAAVVAPPEPPVVAAKKKPRRKPAARIAALPPAPVKVRGARLKEKGEALGGRTPERVDKGTMTVPSSQ